MRKHLFPLLTAVALGGAIIIHLETKAPVANTIVALDPSGSMLRNCGALAEGAKTWLANKPGIQDGSTLTVLIMGKDAINPEPTPAFTKPIPIEDDSVIGGRSQEYQVANEQLFGDVKQACEAAKAGRQSPIYQMVRQGIALLRGSSGEGHGYILLKSDLDDDAHPALSVLLRQAARKSDVAVPAALTGSLDNSNVSIEICGTSELAPRKGTPTSSFETRLRIWEAMFTHPELVTTRPFCGAGPTR